MVIFKTKVGDEKMELGMVIGYPFNPKAGPVMEIQKVPPGDARWEPYREYHLAQLLPEQWSSVIPFNSASFSFQGSVADHKVESLSMMTFSCSRRGVSWVIGVGEDYDDPQTVSGAGLRRLYTCLVRYSDYLIGEAKNVQ